MITPLRFACWNLENFSNQKPERVKAIARAIADAPLASPHIIALQEMSGDYVAPNTPHSLYAYGNAQALIDAIREAGGKVYTYADIPPSGRDGGLPGGNIRCGYIYRPDRVQLLHPLTAVGATAKAFEGGRKPLAAEFIDMASHEHYHCVNVHLRGRLTPERFKKTTGFQGSEAELKTALPAANKKRDIQRIEQARLVADYLGQLPPATAMYHQVVLGDFNSNAPEIFASLRQQGFETFSLPGSQFSSVSWEGRREHIDHLFASPDMLARIGKIERAMLNEGIRAPKQTLSDHNPTYCSVSPRQHDQTTGIPLPPR